MTAQVLRSCFGGVLGKKGELARNWHARNEGEHTRTNCFNLLRGSILMRADTSSELHMEYIIGNNTGYDMDKSLENVGICNLVLDKSCGTSYEYAHVCCRVVTHTTVQVVGINPITPQQRIRFSKRTPLGQELRGNASCRRNLHYNSPLSPVRVRGILFLTILAPHQPVPVLFVSCC